MIFKPSKGMKGGGLVGLEIGGSLAGSSSYNMQTRSNIPLPTIDNVVEDSPWTRLKKQQRDSYEPGSPSTGTMGNLDYAVFVKQKAYQQFMTFLEKTAQDGRIYAAIENGSNAFAEIARRDTYQRFDSYTK